MTDPAVRASDRWVTPAVVVTGLLVAGALVALLVCAVAWLTAQRIDPGPMLDLVAQIVTAVSAVGALALQLANRSSVTKTERNTGQIKAETGALATAMYEVADAMPRPRPLARHGDPDETRYLETRGAPASRGS